MPKRKQHNRDNVNLTLTEDLIREAAAIVRKGNFRYVTANKLGIPQDTWNRWLQYGRGELRAYIHGCGPEELTLKARLVLALEKAEGECHATLLEDVIESDNVQAKIWFLQRRYNKLYSKNPNAHVDDETGEVIRRSATEILADKLAQFLEDDDAPSDN
jgi:hypothetical protein